jgi:hypothetical protein
MLLATPDFGAGATVFGFIIILGLATVAIALGGILWGSALLKRGSRTGKSCGLVVLVVSGLLPVTYCQAPNILARCMYGRFLLLMDPSVRIAKGMSMEEVKANLGDPHEHFRGHEGERWFYYVAPFGIGYWGIDFDTDERVVSIYGD